MSNATKPMKVRILTGNYIFEGSVDGSGQESVLEFMQNAGDFLTLSDVTVFHSASRAAMFNSEHSVIPTSSVLSILPVKGMEQGSKSDSISETNVLPTVGFMTVKEVMTKKVLTVTTHDDVKEAFRLMTSNRIRHLPVVENNLLVGLVTDRDLRIFLMGGKEMPIEEILIPLVRLHTIGPDDSLMLACETMIEKKISCLPVVHDGKVQGLVTESDLVRFLKDIFDSSDL